MLVRLKPYDPAKGHKLRSLCISSLGGKIYRGEHPWYEEPDHIAAQLALVNQDGSMSEEPIVGLPRAFDVMTREQVAALGQRELHARLGTPGGDRVFIAPDRTSRSKAAVPVVQPLPPAPAKPLSEQPSEHVGEDTPAGETTGEGEPAPSENEAPPAAPVPTPAAPSRVGKKKGD